MVEYVLRATLEERGTIQDPVYVYRRVSHVNEIHDLKPQMAQEGWSFIKAWKLPYANPGDPEIQTEWWRRKPRGTP